jgi:hypothetical protein
MQKAAYMFFSLVRLFSNGFHSPRSIFMVRWYSIRSMIRVRVFPVTSAIAFLTAIGLGCAAQSFHPVPTGSPRFKPIPAKQYPMPFSPAPQGQKSANAIEFRSADQMSEPDRNLEADAESSIAEHAGYVGLDLNDGKWSYRQVVCPALPNHLFLRFTRNNGARDVSVFSASIPRNGEGRVRIVPILLRSYSLFSPTPVNAMTISAFNRIRDEEHPERAESWVGLGLCYAALAGANPQLPRQDKLLPGGKAYPGLVAILDVQGDGASAIQFTDEAANPRPMEWDLIFNADGKLLKTKRIPAPLYSIRKVPPGPEDLALGVGAPKTISRTDSGAAFTPAP